jgi:O-acetyl-ADP-ribose deacetylase (regulator of RNase III)
MSKIVIEVKQGDITEADTEAIVNAANNEFWMGSGVAGAIKKAGGQVIEEEAMAKGSVMPGDAVYTGAGQLRFKYVIHGAAMGQDLKTTDKLIRQTTFACLNICEKLKLKSVAFPAFGTGVGGFPVKACANLMVNAVRHYESSAASLERVQFVLFDEAAYAVFKQVAKAENA